uniref:CPSF_A domain-containing protein n=1 Tax=Haemonchus placei TaxID=6290 RepID=A0A0N4WE57_HAEPC
LATDINFFCFIFTLVIRLIHFSRGRKAFPLYRNQGQENFFAKKQNAIGYYLSKQLSDCIDTNLIQMYDDVQFVKRSNAELINGLIGMDLGKLSAVGKRSNAELINGLLGMNLNKLSSAGRR